MASALGDTTRERMATRTKTWTVALHGKWGGTRTVTVQAATEAVAKRRARDQARADESVRTASPVEPVQ